MSTDSSAELETPDVIDGRYRFVKRLGRGGMGTVCLVNDLFHSGRQLALKQLRRDRSDAKTIAILKNEFLALANLVHPNLARVYDFGLDRAHEQYYFTAEYVRGIQLYKATQGLTLSTTGDLRMLIYLFVEILRALEFIHSRGFVHGDLKPENILVSSSADPSENDPTKGVGVKIIDFGLTKREKEFGGKKIFGTSCYIAPETILGTQVDRRTDLYSLGVVFYHMAVRKLPFSGKSNFMVLRGHLEEIPEPPSAINASVPGELSEIILRLMAKKPVDRYPSALAVIEDINARFGMRFPIETAPSTAAFLRSPRCVGRARELHELHSFFSAKYPQRDLDTEDGLELSFGADAGAEDTVVDLPPPPSGQFFLIRGEDRIGKSRLVEEFKSYVQVRDVAFLELELELEPMTADTNLMRFFDQLKRVYNSEENALQAYLLKILSSLPKNLQDANAEQREAALQVLCDALLPACRSRPLVLVFSKLDHGGDVFLGFLRILVEKIAQAGESQISLLIVATVTEEKIDAVALRRLLLSPEVRSHFREIALERLTRDELEQLLQAMFAPHCFSPTLIENVFEESDGNPGVVVEILEHFVKRGHLRHAQEGWHFVGELDRQSIPGHVRSELKKRIQSLSPDSIRLGLAFAFLGNSCELDLAAQLADIEPSKILPTLMRLKTSRMLREDGEGKSDYYSFTQRSARELFVQLASPSEQVKIHRRAGGILEERSKSGQGRDARRLAYHYLRGGSLQAGIEYSLVAADELLDAYFPSRALDVLWEMRKRCPEEEIPEVREIDFRIATLEASLGNNRFAMEILLSLLEDARKEPGDLLWKAKVMIELGAVYSQLGEFRRGGKFLKEAYQIVKAQGAGELFRRLLVAYGWLFQLRGNFLESSRYCDKVLETIDDLDVPQRVQVYMLVAENQTRLNNFKLATEYCTRALSIVDGHRQTGYFGFTCFALAKSASISGRYETALKHFGNAAGMFRRNGLKGWEASSYHGMGEMLLTIGEPTMARKLLIRAMQILESTENMSRQVDTLQLLGEAHRVLGRYEEAEEFIRRALAHCEKGGFRRKRLEINFICSRICLDRGNLVQAAEFLNVSDPRSRREFEDDVLVLAKLSMQSRIALDQGDYRRCLDLLALATIRSREVHDRLRVAPILELRARLYLILGKDGDAQRALSQLLDFGQDVRLPIVTAVASMLIGKAMLSKGAVSQAIDRYTSSLAVFKDKDAERELAEVYLELGHAHLEQGSLEQASTFLEEGIYLAKKLNLISLRMRYMFVMGLLESRSPEGDFGRATNYFQSAYRLARTHGFTGFLWQIRAANGRLLFERESREEASRLLQDAVGLLRSMRERIPESYRESYLRSHRAHEFEELLKQCSFQPAPSAEIQADAIVPATPRGVVTRELTNDERPELGAGSADSPADSPED